MFGPRRLTARAAMVAVAAMLAACASDDALTVDDERAPEDVFAEAETLAQAGDNLAAAQLFDEVERISPYSQAAKRAVLRSAQSYYYAGRFDEARLAAERFLSLYPSDPEAAEAQYIRSLSWYEQIVDVGRDQANTREALDALRETVQRYPNSEYARSASLKLDLALDHLAGKEMEIGRYYLKRAHYAGAINRFRTVISTYQTTSHVPEALHRLVESYLALGVTREAQNAAAVLGHNFPGSPWYARSYSLLTGLDLAPEDDQDGWLERSYRQVIKGEWL